MTITVATLNIKATLDLNRARDDFSTLLRAANPDIIGLQEFTPRRNNFAFGSVGYSFLKLDNENPIAWKSDHFDLHRARDLTISKTAFWRPSERRFIKVKATEVVLLKGYDRIFVLNTHTPSNVQNPRSRRRRRILRQCLNFINDWVKHVREWGGIPVVLGDFNWDAARDGWQGSPENVLKLTSQFAKFGTNARQGTFHHRDIDYIFTDYDNLVSTGIVSGLHSDHNAAYARLRI